MNKRKLASALLAGALLFTSTIPASAAKATGTPTPHQVFYREEAGQTFAGKIHMEKGCYRSGGGATRLFPFRPGRGGFV